MLVDLLLALYIISTGLTLICNIGAYSYLRTKSMVTIHGKKILLKTKRKSLRISLVFLFVLSVLPVVNTWIGFSYLSALIRNILGKLMFKKLGGK